MNNNYLNGYFGAQIFLLLLRWPFGLGCVLITIWSLASWNVNSGLEKAWDTPNLAYLSDTSIDIGKRCNLDEWPKRPNRAEKRAYRHVCLPSERYQKQADLELFALDPQSPEWDKKKKEIGTEMKRLQTLEKSGSEEVGRLNNSAALPVLDRRTRRWHLKS